MIFKKIDDVLHDDVFLEINGLIDDLDVIIKLECFNLGHSIKLKTAKALIDAAEVDGIDASKNRIIESSSGNLGVALSAICASRNYDFTCVVDKNTLKSNIKQMEAYGAKVIVIDKPDNRDGYLGSRIRYIKEQLSYDKDLIWLNQYRNPANIEAHSSKTAQKIINEFPNLDYLFVGAGTTGTLMGCVDAFKNQLPKTKIIAVDSIGSVTFGAPRSKRHIPGLGASVMPFFFDDEYLTDKIQVSEIETIKMCREIASKYGYLPGGSTGTVVAAIKKYASKIPKGSSVVAISPDSGERYVSTIYCDEWVHKNYSNCEV
ncbi:2,3-diaminopropionate biosynthesis protein SbnA [Vibrio caribbeanicus]|uniref:cysteine synthase n=1 Tax=Vibrio caribbeanicus ATCC BAA-2122 TaxID=796620 RepID=E3BMD8_9VIBR|nr:2,3-diaminopropionate biosynthesis protein SbnA [Vibrio caribbeanicus]EFP95683.1 Pyridoxal-5'-phosphate-dependent protein beta subunit [Vibrio caribbeanicus ATCC BAA-2122]